MWWLLVPAAVGVGTWLINRPSKSPVRSSTATRGPASATRVPVATPGLARNIARLRNELNADPTHPRIFVIGLGGAGKSSLIDAITDDGCVPRPIVGIQTDATDWSRADVATALNWQDVFVVDVPGYGTSQHPSDFLARHLPFGLADIVLFVVAGKIMADDCMVFHAASAAIAERLWLVRTMADAAHNATPEQILQAAVNGLSAPSGTPAFVVSAATGDGIGALQASINTEICNARARRMGRSRKYDATSNPDGW